MHVCVLQPPAAGYCCCSCGMLLVRHALRQCSARPTLLQLLILLIIPVIIPRSFLQPSRLLLQGCTHPLDPPFKPLLLCMFIPGPLQDEGLCNDADPAVCGRQRQAILHAAGATLRLSAACGHQERRTAHCSTQPLRHQCELISVAERTSRCCKSFSSSSRHAMAAMSLRDQGS